MILFLVYNTGLDAVKYSDIVDVCIERTLSENGVEIWKKVESKLLSEYNAKFTDCFRHPEYFKNILKKYYPERYPQIIQSLTEYLSEFNIDENLRGFLEKLQNDSTGFS